MKNGRQHRRRNRSLLLAGMLTFGLSGCDIADDPAYRYVEGVGIGVLNGLISTTVDVIGATLGSILFPNADNSST